MASSLLLPASARMPRAAALRATRQTPRARPAERAAGGRDKAAQRSPKAQCRPHQSSPWRASARATAESRNPDAAGGDEAELRAGAADIHGDGILYKRFRAMKVASRHFRSVGTAWSRMTSPDDGNNAGSAPAAMPDAGRSRRPVRQAAGRVGVRRSCGLGFHGRGHGLSGHDASKARAWNCIARRATRGATPKQEWLGRARPMRRTSCNPLI